MTVVKATRNAVLMGVATIAWDLLVTIVSLLHDVKLNLFFELNGNLFFMLIVNE